MRVEETARAVADQLGDGDAEAEPLAEVAEHVGGALAALAEAEIRSDRHMGEAQLAGEDVAGEFLGRQRLPGGR